MPLLGELAVGTLNGGRIGISSNAQNFVKVTSRLVASGHEQASAALALSVVVIVIAIQKRRRSLGVFSGDTAAR
jgi:hypothetical protein